ncbi:hypothetical protein F5Y10DRAFT_237209 [Nemania abortiva]|nr:hypothetical protein F5Y10DRAFT_237209 [Nemania abortiva]
MTYTPAHNDVSWKGYLIRNDQSWGWSCTLAMSYNTESRSSYSVCIGLQRDEIDVFLKHLEIGKRYARVPLFLPSVLAELYISNTTALINRQHREDFFYIQAVMKTDDYFKSGKVRGPLDLVGFSSKLTALGTSSAGVAQLCSTQDRIVRFLEDECQKMMREGTSEFLADVDEMIVFTRELLRGEQQHNEYNRAAAAAQVQMVYSLTAQRDSDQSHKLALLSQEQNNINVEISRFAAYESRLSNRMAEESLKYGVDMQVIAAVTLTFLPGTFIATLFSSSFWDFHPEPTGQVVSKWIWLYFVLTIALTLAVLAGWRVASRMKTDGLEMPPELEPGKLLKVNGRDRQAEEEGLA